MTNTKICNHCKKELDVNNFYKKKSCSDGLNPSCKDCYKNWNKNWYSTNHNRALKQRKKYRLSNHEKCLQSYRDWAMDNIDKRRYNTKKQKYKRKGMKFVSLFDSPFPEEICVDNHHINSIITIPIPKQLHINCNHNNREEHRRKCSYWINYLYGIDIDKLFDSSCKNI